MAGQWWARKRSNNLITSRLTSTERVWPVRGDRWQGVGQCGANSPVCSWPSHGGFPWCPENGYLVFSVGLQGRVANWTKRGPECGFFCSVVIWEIREVGSGTQVPRRRGEEKVLLLKG